MDPKLTEALRQVIDDVRLPRAGNPAVVRGALTDLVSEDARAWRGDIDALVLAAEEGVTDAVASGESARLEAVIEALAERGVDQSVAEEAVDAWRTALGAATTAAPVPATAAAVESAALIGDGTIVPKPTDDTEGTVLPEAAPIAARREAPPRRQTMLVAAAIIVFVALLGGAVAVALNRGGDGEETATEVEGEVTAVDSTESTTTTTIVETTTSSTDTTVAPDPGSDQGQDPGTGGGGGAAPGPGVTTPPAPPTPTTAAPYIPPPPPPPPAAPVAYDDSWDWTPVYNGGWYQATLPITTYSGDADQIQISGLAVGHGSLTQSGFTAYFTPHHNGYFTDSFSFRVKNGDSAWSNWATIYLTVYCNSSYACY